MEYCSGNDMFFYLNTKDFEILESRAANLMFDICSALNYLHQLGIIHRDLKPENIMMSDETDEGIPKIADFGLSRFLTNGTFCTESHGTVVSLNF